MNIQTGSTREGGKEIWGEKVVKTAILLASELASHPPSMNRIKRGGKKSARIHLAGRSEEREKGGSGRKMGTRR